MKANYRNYDFRKSAERIQKILNASNSNFEGAFSIPSRDKLTFTNGFYVDCTAIFVDIRGSSDLSSVHTRPVLSKIYRAYISEVVAVMSGTLTCAEVSIVGDCVSSIHNTPGKGDIDEAFGTAKRISSLVDILNYKLGKRNYSTIDIGIGIDYGRALMVKAGYVGGAMNDVVWMGDVANGAAKLCGQANRHPNMEIMVSSAFYERLSGYNKELLCYQKKACCYYGDITDSAMNDWLEEQA